MSGGSLIQHVEGHHVDHTILTETGLKLTTTSTHHQMMNPYDVHHQVIAWCPTSLSDTYKNGSNKEHLLDSAFQEVEIVYYPNTLSLCIQGHPEFDTVDEDYKEYCVKLIQNLINYER
jgi:hypothetical protein